MGLMGPMPAGHERACIRMPTRLKTPMPRPAISHALALALQFAWLAGLVGPIQAAEPRPAASHDPPPAASTPARDNPQRVAAQAVCQTKTLAELIPLLGDEQFHIRQCAEEKLHELLHAAPADQPNEVEQVCYQTYRTDPDPEIRGRVRAVLADFATHLWSPHGFVGLVFVPDSEFAADGEPVSLLKVTKVLANGPAAKAGVKVNDRIHRIDDVQFKMATAANQFDQYLAGKKPADSVVLDLERDDNRIQITVMLGCKPRGSTRTDHGKESPPDPERCLREYLKAKNPEPVRPAREPGS